LSLVNTSYAAYARDESLNKREELFALTMNNISKYSPGTAAGITKDISKYSSSILAIIINDISKHGPALFRQMMYSNTRTDLHTGNYHEKIFTNTALAQLQVSRKISPNTALLYLQLS